MIQFPLDIPNRDEGEKKENMGDWKIKKKIWSRVQLFFLFYLSSEKKIENTDSENTEMIGNRWKKSSYGTEKA